SCARSGAWAKLRRPRPARGACPRPRPCPPRGSAGAWPRTRPRAAARGQAAGAAALPRVAEAEAEEQGAAPAAEARAPEAQPRAAGPPRASREARAAGPPGLARPVGARGAYAGPTRARPRPRAARRLRMRHFDSQEALFHDEEARGKGVRPLYSDDFLPRPAPPFPERREQARPLQTVGRRNREL